MTGKILRGCARCGKGFTPRGARDRYCPACRPVGNASRSPTTRERPSSRVERERIRAEVLAGGPSCAIAGPNCTGLATTIDHIVPVVLGGGHERTNLRPACATCNSEEGGRAAHQRRDASRPPAAPAPERTSRPTGRILH